MLHGFTKGGKCGCFKVLINKWRSWVQSTLSTIYLTCNLPWVQSTIRSIQHDVQSGFDARLELNLDVLSQENDYGRLKLSNNSNNDFLKRMLASSVRADLKKLVKSIIWLIETSCWYNLLMLHYCLCWAKITFTYYCLSLRFTHPLIIT